MDNDKFSIKEALTYGWETFKANVPFFLGLMVVLGLFTMLPDILADKFLEPRSAGLIVTKIIVRLVGLILGMVSTRISLDIHDSGQPNLAGLKDLIPQIPFYVIGKVLYGLAVLVGMILLIVPGIIVAYMFLYVGYLIIDKQLGPIAAFSKSRAITDGYKLPLFVFSLVIALINLVGALALFIGLFVTIPITLMSSVYVYRRLCPADAATAQSPPNRRNSYFNASFSGLTKASAELAGR